VESQNKRILHLLQHGAKLTQIDTKDWCLRLAARIDDLKREGHPVQSELVRRGDAMVAEYSLVPAGELFAVAERWE